MAIIEYDKSPGISNEERLRSLANSVMRALDEVENTMENMPTPTVSGEGGTYIVQFDSLTDEQKEELRGPQGVQGIQGERGEQGPPGPSSQPQVVWTNPAPSSNYAAATIEVTLPEDAIVEVFYRWSTRILSERVRVGDSTALQAFGNVSNDGAYPRLYSRIVTVNTDSIVFEDCYGSQTNQANTLGLQNGNCVPVAVYM